MYTHFQMMCLTLINYYYPHYDTICPIIPMIIPMIYPSDVRLAIVNGRLTLYQIPNPQPLIIPVNPHHMYIYIYKYIYIDTVIKLAIWEW